MTSEERKRMAELIEQIQEEKDHFRFNELVDELNALLEAQEQRFPLPPKKKPQTHY